MPQLLSVTNHETPAALSVVMREFVRHFLFQQRQFAAEQGQSTGARMLLILSRYEPMTQTELGQLLGLEKSWISRSVQSLVEQGWIERRALASDKRCALLHMTNAGLAQAQTLETSFNQHAQQVLNQIPLTQHDELMQSFQILLTALRATPDFAPEDHHD